MNDTPEFSRAAVAAPHRLAAAAGRDCLAQGGNAIEVMVAMAATIAVVYPHMNSIGGDGFWLIREPGGRVRAIEACGYAGEHATVEAYRKLGHETIPTRGPLAALTVPGTIGGWIAALELAKALGGRLPLKTLLDAAERHALDGYAISASEGRYDPTTDAALMAAPGFAETFLVDGKRPQAGANRRLPRLAETLAQLAHAGLDDFYRGDVGREIAADLERIGSFVTRADLTRYQAAWREPLSLRIKGATLYNTPAPTQGLASLVLLGLYERLGVGAVDSFAHAHALIEATKRALTIRNEACVDFAHATHDFAAILSAGWLDAQAARIDKGRAAPWPLPADKGDTVWMGAIDDNGLAVSFIQSVYWEYGSGCVLPATGVTMQNRGLAFSLEPGARNRLRPGRRPTHTLNPPLAVFDDGRVLSYGSMGGDGQPQFQAQVFTRIAAGQDPLQAVGAPRFLFGRSWGAETISVKLEEGYDDTVAAALAKAGHDIEWRGPAQRDQLGHAGALLRNVKGSIAATHDPRSDGGADGL
ncbi:MAG: gamma-glutamyltransferase [Hyphomicrobiales bacterium]|nr:gamma-glutamyltransferase [Hyphomicrobiales bacterium]